MFWGWEALVAETPWTSEETPETCLKGLDCLIAQGGRVFFSWLVLVFPFFSLLGFNKTYKNISDVSGFFFVCLLFNRKHCVFGIWRHHSLQRWTIQEMFSSQRIVYQSGDHPSRIIHQDPPDKKTAFDREDQGTNNFSAWLSTGALTSSIPTTMLKIQDYWLC